MGRRRIRPYPLQKAQHAQKIDGVSAVIDLDLLKFGTHSMRLIKATLIDRHIGYLRVVQLMLGHTKIESTVRCFGIEIDNAIDIAEKIDV